MTERPILFNAEMVRAILDGRKTQTRRPVKPQPPAFVDGFMILFCPLGIPGDRLWVRETFHYGRTRADAVWYAVDGGPPEDADIYDEWAKEKTPSIHMPRWASRITLEVTEVRVERVQDAHKADLVSEGWPGIVDDEFAQAVVAARLDESIDDGVIEWFVELWDSIYAKQGLDWDANPWVWVVEFRRVP